MMYGLSREQKAQMIKDIAVDKKNRLKSSYEFKEFIKGVNSDTDRSIHIMDYVLWHASHDIHTGTVYSFCRLMLNEKFHPRIYRTLLFVVKDLRWAQDLVVEIRERSSLVKPRCLICGIDLRFGCSCHLGPEHFNDDILI